MIRWDARKKHVTLQWQVAAQAGDAAAQQKVSPALQKPLLLLLELHVRARERVEDGGDGERHEQDPAEDAAKRHHLSRDAARHHVTVTHRGHGDHGPPVRCRDATELSRGPGLVLDQVEERREESYGHAEKEEEQAELPRAPARRQPERLESERVARQPHHVEDA